MFLPFAASTSSPLFWLCLAIAIWPVLFVSVVLHEAGHAFAGKLVGYHIAAWGVGTGEPLWVFPSPSCPAQTRFFLCRHQPLHGLTGAIYPGLFPKRRQAATLLLGGAVTNVLLAFLGFVLLRSTSGAGYPVSIAWIGVNALLCLMALMPTRSRGITDGAQLLGLMSSHGTRLRAPAPETWLAHASLWRMVGATTVLQFEQLSLAASLVEMGNLESAIPYLQAATLHTSPALAAYAALVDGQRQEAIGNGSKAHEQFARAGAWYAKMGYGAAADMARLHEAGMDQARLESLYVTSTVKDVPALRTLAAYRLLLAVCLAQRREQASLAIAVSRYQSARLAWRSDVQDAIAFTAADHALRRNGDTVGAETLYKQAQAAIGQVRFALAYHPALMEAFDQYVERQTAGT